MNFEFSSRHIFKKFIFSSNLRRRGFRGSVSRMYCSHIVNNRHLLYNAWRDVYQLSCQVPESVAINLTDSNVCAGISVFSYNVFRYTTEISLVRHYSAFTVDATRLPTWSSLVAMSWLSTSGPTEASSGAAFRLPTRPVCPQVCLSVRLSVCLSAIDGVHAYVTSNSSKGGSKSDF